MLRVALLGKHSKRIPLSYAPYKLMASNKLEFTEDLESADILLFGFEIDFSEYMEKIKTLIEKNSNIKICVLSEEPLWDTLWSRDYTKKFLLKDLTKLPFDYYFLNHYTTNIYKFKRYPYFITTDDDFFARYNYFFKRNISLTANEILSIWHKAKYREVYMFEYRKGPTYEIKKSVDGVLGLCVYRTKVAELSKGDNVLRMGLGWNNNNFRRQNLPDWHLDKLVTLDRQVFIVSALENTHMQNYITEKIFDAFAVLGIPIYYASPDHSIFKIIPKGSFINLYGLEPEDAAEIIANFEPDKDFVEAYMTAQQQLSALFSDAFSYIYERRSFLCKIFKELENLI